MCTFFPVVYYKTDTEAFEAGYGFALYGKYCRRSSAQEIVWHKKSNKI